MNKKITTILLLPLISAVILSAQDTEPFLREVADKHPLISSYNAILEARKSEVATGNTPGPFSVGFGYYPGTPEETGLKRTFSAAQSFEFPTRYILRAKLNRELLELAETEFMAGSIATLLDAKETAYDYIASRETLALLREKERGHETLRNAWQQMLDEGAVTVLDYNRLTLELSGTNSEIAITEAEMRSLTERLDYLSENNSSLLKDADYTVFDEPELETVISDRKREHPAFILRDKEYSVATREVKLSRAMNFPDIEIGVGSERIGSNHHTGPFIGLSIPVWTNRNRVKLSKANKVVANTLRENYQEELTAMTEANYAVYTTIKKQYEETVELLANTGKTDKLTKALHEREITITEYFSYMNALYEVKMSVVDMRKRYNKALIKLYDHKLTGVM